MVLNTSYNVCKLDAYPDADISGIYIHEKPTDPECVKRRTIFIIPFVICPVLWVSKLQTETSLSTIEAEIIAMAHYFRYFFLLSTLRIHLIRQLVCLWLIQ